MLLEGAHGPVRGLEMCIRDRRIAAARELLEKTNMRMYEVCDAVGYNSVEPVSYTHLDVYKRQCMV